MPRNACRRALTTATTALVCFITAPATAQNAKPIPTPESVFGFPVGADYKLFTYDQSIEYFRKLAAASNRIKLIHVGKTANGKDWTVAIISSPENLAKLAQYRAINMRLAHPDGLTDAEAKALDPAMFEKRGNDKWNVRVPGGGENYADVAARAESWIGEMTADTFAVAHGAFTRILRGLFMGVDWKAMSNLDEKQGVLFRVRGNTIKRFDPPEGLEKPAGLHPSG
ncbi:MAG TPA: histidine phosphatase family protein [Rhizomicrobium sp.]|nr:histidine phosphatase family protein [Rhizomicrobium sp.]